MSESLCIEEELSLESKMEKKVMEISDKKEVKDKKEEKIERLEQVGKISDSEGLGGEDRVTKLNKLREKVSSIGRGIKTLEDEVESIRSRLEN